MDAVPPSFTFLKLPEKEQLRVARVMEPFTAIPFSMCTEKTKQLVESSGVKCAEIQVRFGICHHIFLKFFYESSTLISFKTAEPDDPESNLDYEGHVFGVQRDYQSFVVKNFTFQTCLEFFFSITNCHRVNLHITKDAAYDLFPIKQMFSGKNLNMVHMSVSPEYGRILLNQLPSTKGLEYSFNLEKEDFEKIAIQNFDELSMDGQLVALNDLLLVNGAYVAVYEKCLTTKDLNRFLKMWIKGSNPQLKRLHVATAQVWTDRDDCIRELTRGIPCQKVENEPYHFWSTRFSQNRVINRSGNDAIYRKDGVKATITVEELLGFTEFKMFIWS